MKYALTAAIAALALAACSQQTTAHEEAGEAMDSAVEQATTGETNLGDGPMEQAGEAADEATENTAKAINDATH